MVIWMTGLSGAGKSTLADELEGFVNIDGDVLRKGLCSDLGFSEEDRRENMRRLRELCKLLSKLNHHVVTSFISPYEDERRRAKEEIPNCSIVWVKSSLDKCIDRDTKGMYAKAIKGEIPEFTGISSPYEEPVLCDLVIDTEKQSVEESVLQLVDFITERINR